MERITVQWMLEEDGPGDRVVLRGPVGKLCVGLSAVRCSI